MKKLVYLLVAFVCAGVVGCGGHKDEYVIKGSTSQSRLDGERVFLVPYGTKAYEDSIGVDSVVIKNGKFEFRGHKGEFLARVTMDKRVRYGTEDLLIVTEPGEITVVIDSVSSGIGTPQNDLLQAWKVLKQDHDKVHWNQSQHIKYLREQGDTVYANALADSLRTYNESYLKLIHDLMRTTGPGTAYEVLRQRYGDPE
ncbi:MAG: DUF4369 domain-containing protein [Muribaculaceae bacterium]|nr:DUF4369 domain-containing protein [Muribaculaceae bacterium]